MKAQEQMGLVKKGAVRATLGLIGLVALLFIPCGTFSYWQGWIYLGVVMVPMFAFGSWLVCHRPEVAERRMRSHEKEPTQRLIVALSAVPWLGMIVVPSLDFRWHFSPSALVPSSLLIFAGDILVLTGYALFVRVLLENPYASRVVEVDKPPQNKQTYTEEKDQASQQEPHQRIRGDKSNGIGPSTTGSTESPQFVISTGPYAFVRHPMYSAISLMCMATPVALGSFIGIVFSVGCVILLGFRAVDEERVLIRDLAGYNDYIHRTKSRIVPGVW